MRKAFLVLVACVAVGLGGCGGSEDSVSTGSSTSEATPTPSTAQTEDKNTAAQDQDKGKANKSPTAKGEGSPAKEGNKDSSSSHPKPVVKPPAISKAPVAGSKAPAPGVKTVPDGDNSVQEYGVEADESSRREAAIALQAYLDARAQEDWGTACSLLAKRPTEQLEKLAGQSQADCAEVLKATAKGTSSQPGSAITEVLSFRGEGDISGNPSYLIFEGPPGGTLFSMPMYLQGGAWKVGLAQPSELPV